MHPVIVPVIYHSREKNTRFHFNILTIVDYSIHSTQLPQYDLLCNQSQCVCMCVCGTGVMHVVFLVNGISSKTRRGQLIVI